MSEKTHFDSDCAIRGGIPICWPWFGAGRRGVESPLHGFARLSEWRLVSTKQNQDAVSATYILIDAWIDKFDYPYRLTYEVSFGKSFSATLKVRNTGTRRFSFEEALHAYLRVGDVRKIKITGLNGSAYLDRVSGHPLGPHQQDGDVFLTAETERIYQSTTDIAVVDPGLRRQINMTRTGSQDIVLWNPWVDKARFMPDVGDDEWIGMVCIETANVGEHAIVLNPGKEHVMGFALGLSELD